jgi:hypothetical protein
MVQPCSWLSHPLVPQPDSDLLGTLLPIEVEIMSNPQTRSNLKRRKAPPLDLSTDHSRNQLYSYRNDDVEQIVKERSQLETYQEVLKNAVHDIFNKSPWTFHYNPLPDGHIRLLALEPGQGDDPLEARLHSAKLDDPNLTYDALS